MKDKYKIALFISHPIHYLIGLSKKISEDKDIDAHIYFGSDFGIREGIDSTFGKRVKWYSSDILNDLPHSFLKNLSPVKDPKGFFSICNPGIFKELRKNNYDALVIHGWNYLSNWLAIMAGIITRTPVFIRGENPMNQEILKPKWKIFFKTIIFKRIIFPRISGFFYIGEENKKFYQFYGVPEDKLFFVPYAVDNDWFINQANKLKNNREDIRKKIGIRPDSTVILFVGKFIEKKRPGDLLEALRLIREQNKEDNTSLLFVGDGWLRKDLENYVAKWSLENVYFVGFKNQLELPEYYSIADVFVLPSSMGETWGLVVNEAMCFGLPVIVSNMVGCGPNLVLNGENGFTYKMGDVGQLAESLKKIIFEKSKRNSFGKKSLEVIKNYSFKADADAITKAVRENLNSHD